MSLSRPTPAVPATPLTALPVGALALVMTTGYALLSRFGETLTNTEGISIFWPASGFAAVMLLWAQTPRRRAVVIAGLVAGLALNAVWRGELLVNEFGYLVGNVLEPLIVLPFLIRGTSAARRLDRPASLAWLLGGAVLATTIVAAVVATLGVWSYDGTDDFATWPPTWLAFALGDLIGLLVVVPLMLQATPVTRLWAEGAVVQQAVLWALLVAAAVGATIAPEGVLVLMVALVFMALLLDSSATSLGLLLFVAVVLWQWKHGQWSTAPTRSDVDPRLVLVGVVILVQSIALSTTQRRAALAGQQAALNEIRDARAVLDAVVDAAPVGIAMYTVVEDDSGETAFALSFMNRHGRREGGMDATELSEAELAEIYPDLVTTGLYANFVEAWRTQRPQEFIVNSEHSGTLWRGVYQNHVAPLSGNRLVAVWNDITGIIGARDEAEENWTLLRRALDSGLDAFFVVERDAETWDIVFVNHAGAAHCAVSAEALTGAPVEKALPYEVRSAVLTLITAASTTKRPQQTLLDMRDRDGGWNGEFDLLVTPVGARRVVLTLRDVTEVQMSRRALEEAHSAAVAASRRDPLTGLPNRIALTEHLHSALVGARGSGRSVAVAFLDIDAFKAINDVHGHAVGDGVLTLLAARLRGCTRASDMAGRLGGDEFLVVFTGLREDSGTEQLRQRLAPALHLKVPLGEATLTVTVSAGLAMGGAGADASLLVQRADAAMYASKAVGRGQVVLYEPGMRRGEQRWGTLEES